MALVPARWGQQATSSQLLVSCSERPKGSTLANDGRSENNRSTSRRALVGTIHVEYQRCGLDEDEFVGVWVIGSGISLVV